MYTTNSARENREGSWSLAADGAGEPQGEGQGRNPEMNDHERSNECVVPTKPGNKSARAEADSVEGRRSTAENLKQRNANRAQKRGDAPNGLQRVREAARRDKTTRFTTLLHHVTPKLLEEAYRGLKRSAAAGIDGQTWKDYGEQLASNLADLHGRIHRGAYRAKPGRRSYIAKADGTQRALAIAAIEDKIAQSAVSEVLNAIYEEDFLGFCYGFRKKKSQHDALSALATALLKRKVNWVLDADIRGFFDAIDHEWMRKFVEHRVGDQRVVRLIMKWLKAGVMEEGKWIEPEQGTPQGGTISPLLANIYLYYAFDTWAHHWRKRKAKGDVVIVRYADDFVVGFEHREDAERFRIELGERLRKFALELHPDKTRVVEFGRFAAERRARRGEGKPETFTFLGFTHVCTKNRRGWFHLGRVTNRKRMTRKLHEIGTELKARRHDPIPEQGRWLRSVVQGHDNYYAVPGNMEALRAFRRGIVWLWRTALRRRSQRTRLTEARMQRLCAKWLPPAEILHLSPNEPFAVSICGRNRMR
jgi:group II intron reverse transcriptase/maturase